MDAHSQPLAIREKIKRTDEPTRIQACEIIGTAPLYGIKNAMIRQTTGEFKLDEHKLVIHPELTLTQFLAGDITIVGCSESTKMGWVSLCFNGAIDGMNAKFTIQFRFGIIQLLSWELAETNNLSAEELERQMNLWLSEVIGCPPPYQYNWGLIGSAGVDPHSGIPAIVVAFKNKILDMGFKDIASYYEFLRSYRK